MVPVKDLVLANLLHLATSDPPVLMILAGYCGPTAPTSGPVRDTTSVHHPEVPSTAPTNVIGSPFVPAMTPAPGVTDSTPINAVGQQCIPAMTPASGASSLLYVPMISEGVVPALDFFSSRSSLPFVPGSSVAPSTTPAQVSPPPSTAAPP
jgi:hypothetical protein